MLPSRPCLLLCYDHGHARDPVPNKSGAVLMQQRPFTPRRRARVAAITRPTHRRALPLITDTPSFVTGTKHFSYTVRK
jgi:hypothetical protein